ncbi:MAG: ABC transporter ATP-binding protein, partial [Parcubacteria group bacterium]
SVVIAEVLIYNAYVSYKMTGVIVMGTLFILYSYLKNVGDFFFNFAWMYNIMVQRSAAVSLAEVICDEHEKIILKNKKYYLPENWKVLQIKNLKFSYKKKDDEDYVGENINDVSICLERKSKIALIGESGSGKSTILSLIRGLHNAEKANVYCDGKKLSNGLEHFYEHSALVPQDPEIFNASVEENITMGIKMDFSEVKSVIRYACFDTVLARLKKGLKTNVLEKGVSLSGGEKQRLALARGLLMAKKYDFLLLDEPTSSVDSENELNIYKNIFENYKEKTIVSAIHRLHLLRYFDYIYFFEKGKILAEGNFNTLLNDEKFKILWNNYSKSQSDTNT